MQVARPVAKKIRVASVNRREISEIQKAPLWLRLTPSLKFPALNTSSGRVSSARFLSTDRQLVPQTYRSRIDSRSCRRCENARSVFARLMKIRVSAAEHERRAILEMKLNRPLFLDAPKRRGNLICCSCCIRWQVLFPNTLLWTACAYLINGAMKIPIRLFLDIGSTLTVISPGLRAMLREPPHSGTKWLFRMK